MSNSKNKLQFATSPYLLQHANNPVHWEEWSPEVLERASQEHKPLLVSIGYAACHWCHVMAHESFEDEDVAKIMNEHFICIKIDREERPDIDHIYMEAAQMLTGRGGWPLNAFALPDGRPFYAATYFPKENWKKVLINIAKAYATSYDQLLETAIKLTEGIQVAQDFSPPEDSLEFQKSNYQDFLRSWQKFVDLEKGGFKGAPKFPMSNSWQFLLQYYNLTRNHFAAKALTKTLDEMAFGGIYDQIGGGFSRYAVDDGWFAPHFEKMLYDNALLINLYAKAFLSFPNWMYKKVISESIEFVIRELQGHDEGFFSALDADSEGEEGKYYTWTHEELAQLLTTDELLIVENYYNTKVSGNWEASQNILFAKNTPEQYAEVHGKAPSVFKSDLEHINQKLRTYRQKRIRPALDDKILTSWNAMMISGLTQAYVALDRKDYLMQAKQAMKFLIKSRIKKDGRLLRSLKLGKSIAGFLDDYAFTIEALIDLYQVTFQKDYLDTAALLMEICFEDFKDLSTSMFQYTSIKGETLISKTYETSDNVIPASNSSLAKSLFLLGKLLSKANYLETSRLMLQQVEPKLYKSGPYYANWQILYGWFVYSFYEVAVMGEDASGLAPKLQKQNKANSVYLGGTQENLDLLQQKLPTTASETLIYICENKTCKRPTTSINEALKLMEP